MIKTKLQRLLHKKPELTEDVVRLGDIKIPSEFSIYMPKKEKIKEKSKYYKQHKVLEHPITVTCIPNEK